MQNNGDSNDPHQNDQVPAQPPTDHDATHRLTSINDPRGEVVLLRHALLDYSKFEQQEGFSSGNVVEDRKHRGFFLAEDLLRLAILNYATFRSADSRVAKAAAEFGVQGAYRLMDAAMEVFEDRVADLTPQQITDRIIAGIQEWLEECAPTELDQIVRAYLAELQRSPQPSESEGR